MRLAVITALLLRIAASPAFGQRLPATAVPEHYGLTFTVDLARARFEGDEEIRVRLAGPAQQIVLHAADLDLQDVTVTAADATLHATVALNSHDETATLSVPRMLPAGVVDLRIRFTGTLNSRLRGFYLSKGRGRNYAVTQFESTDARRAFPCFDEPAFKATFSLALVVDNGDTAISNGRIVSDTPGPGPHRHTIRFATSPKMSSYLVAMAVGDFQCLEGSSDAIPIRICATPDKKALGAIALDSAEWILRFYDNYYAIKYPFGKLDVVAVPDFAAGAMENTAAIFYRESDLLADSNSASVGTRKDIASVLAHEMAHQWFGDLVTMTWWDDLWLNEGLATWMANHPLDAQKPEWSIAVDEIDETQAAMNLDALKSTRPIHTAVNTPDEIEATFDAIAYEKAAAVLRMAEAYVGADGFRAGINAYLQAHAYGNATSEDFWNAIALSTGKPVDRILPTFINQPGVPLISVSPLECEGARTITRATIDQSRFLIDGSAGDTSERWTIPACTKVAATASAGPCALITQGQQRVELAHGCPRWVFLNAGARGYYRTAYDPSAIRALVPHVQDALSAPERMSLEADEWALVRAGRHTIADYLSLSRAFAGEQVAGVLQLVADRIAFADEHLTTGASHARLARWIRATFGSPLNRIGVAATDADNDNDRELRSTLIALVGNHGDDPDVIAAAKTLLEAALSGHRQLDPTAGAAIIQVAARHGDTSLFARLKDAIGRNESPQQHYRYLFALAAFSDPKLIEQALGYARSGDLRSQDAATYLAQFFRNPSARAPAWSFVKAHWTELEPKIVIAGGDTNLVSSLAAFCEPAARDDIRAFFTAHRLPAAARTLDQTLERIDNCIELKTTQTQALARWVDTER